MTKRSTAPARALAVIALIAGFVVVLIVLSAALGGGDSEGDGGRDRGSSQGQVGPQSSPAKKTPKVYVIQNGDTLTAIARQTGVSVTRIQRLNPDVDPLSLISGEKLKLK